MTPCWRASCCALTMTACWAGVYLGGIATTSSRLVIWFASMVRPLKDLPWNPATSLTYLFSVPRRPDGVWYFALPAKSMLLMLVACPVAGFQTSMAGKFGGVL